MVELGIELTNKSEKINQLKEEILEQDNKMNEKIKMFEDLQNKVLGKKFELISIKYFNDRIYF